MNTNNRSKDPKILWQFPWSYKESFLLVLALSLAAIAIDIVTPIGTPKISSPTNLIFLYVLAALSLLMFWLSKKHDAFKWFYSIPASISATVMFVIPSIILALVPQQKGIGLNFLYNVTSSWLYLVSVVFLLIVLGTVTIRRLSNFKAKRDIGFGLNHFGLWLCLAAAHLGAGDMQKYNMTVTEGQTVWYANNNANQIVELDFAIKLHDFELEEYPAKLAFVNNTEILSKNRKPHLVEIEVDKPFTFEDKTITVQKFLMNSAPVAGRYEEMYGLGATQSVKVGIQDGDSTRFHWISGFSTLYPPQTAPINKTISLVMLKADAKKYKSEVTIYPKGKKEFKTSIEVNKPIKANGWKIYQASYDDSKGKWSDTSVFEIIKDPWLKFVYTGIFMMIAGALYLIWFGKRKD